VCPKPTVAKIHPEERQYFVWFSSTEINSSLIGWCINITSDVRRLKFYLKMSQLSVPTNTKSFGEA